MKNVYRTYIDVINYVKTDVKRVNVDTDEHQKKNNNADVEMNVEDEQVEEDQALKEEHAVMFTEAQIHKFKEFSKDP